MPLVNFNDHVMCSEYATADKVIFKHIFIEAGSVTYRRYIDESLIVIVIKGMLELSYGDIEKQCVGDGMMFLVSKNFDLHINSLEDTEILLCAFSVNLNICPKISLRQLMRYVPEGADYKLYCLPVDSRIRKYAELLCDTIDDGLECINYHRIKRDELIIYLNVGYSNKELASFFYPVLSYDMDFKDFVLTHYKEIHDVKEFAMKANMSLSTFNRNFKNAFNDTAQKWLLARKSENIIEDIVMTDMTFYEISEKYNFSSPSYFVTFCKRLFKLTPNELRKNRRK